MCTILNEYELASRASTRLSFRGKYHVVNLAILQESQHRGYVICLEPEHSQMGRAFAYADWLVVYA